jgi:succinate-semialdehyde dehydrogenase / glutarate-semialdehyde dehydrogenase
LAPKYGSAFIRHSPLGVILDIEPWNFPFYQIARFAAPNVMIGNTVLVKPSSNVPQCGIAFEELFKKANAPAGVYTNLLIPGSKISEMLSDKRIAGASLRGSEKAGYNRCAHNHSHNDDGSGYNQSTP